MEENKTIQIDETTGEIIETTVIEEPKVTPATDGVGYKAIVIQLQDDVAETKAELERRAETNPALAEALTNGKKSWKGWQRYWQNKTRDAHKEFNLGQSPVCVHKEDVWNIAEQYFLNDAIKDVQNDAPKAKPKKEPKPKAEKKSNKVVPLTPQMGSLFGDDDF